MNQEFPEFKFYESILPKIQQFCLDMPELFKETSQKISILPQNIDSELKLSGKQVRCLLCHGFFNTLNTTYLDQIKNKKLQTSFGDMNFTKLYYKNTAESIEKLKCLFFYFLCVFKEEPTEEIIFIRKTLKKSENPDWFSSKTPIRSQVVISDKKFIEDSNAFLHMNFANKNLMMHKIVASFTQEEVLFALRPALYVSLLVSETMLDHEAILMFGCRRYCNYTGYRKTFKFTGPSDELKNNRTIPGIISIDAFENSSVDDQFKKKVVLRDLNKAFAGFSAENFKIQSQIMVKFGR